MRYSHGLAYITFRLHNRVPHAEVMEPARPFQNGEHFMANQTIDQLRSAFRGEIIQPADAAYDSARKVYNGMIDKRPEAHRALRRRG